MAATLETAKHPIGGDSPKRLTVLCLIALCFAVLNFLPSRGEGQGRVPSSLDLIGQAHLRGELDDETALVYRVLAAMDPTRLPPRFSRQPQRLVKSLTPLFLEVRERWVELSPWARSMLAPYLLRPTELGQEPPLYGHSYSVPAIYHDSPGGHFRIWYVTSTHDSPDLIYTQGDTIPDWIHLCARVFDHVREMLVDSLNYRSPPADGSWYGQEDYGGDSRYDVYVENLDEHRVYGYTQSEFFVSGGAPNAATSYIVVDNDYASSIFPSPGEGGLMVTAAHEFFHAIQFAYDTLEERYFMELSSTWMEDVVYDSVNDYYYYLSPAGYASIFSNPELSLTTFDGLHEYSSCLWAHYLAKKFGPGVIREIWENCIQMKALDAMDRALEDRGGDLASAHHEFSVWNYFTGSRADTLLFYPEGDRYPQVKVYSDNLHSAYPVEVSSLSHPPEPLGASYARFLIQDIPGGLNVELEGHSQVQWGASLAGVGPPHEVMEMSIDGFGHGQGQVFNWTRFTEVALVASPFALSGSGEQYAYRAIFDPDLTDSLEAVDWLGQNYPNPVVGDETVVPFSVARGSRVSLWIFTLTGQLVRKFDWGQVSPGSYYGPDKATGGWDLTNESGEWVAAGVYLYQLRMGDFVETKKMVVVR